MSATEWSVSDPHDQEINSEENLNSFANKPLNSTAEINPKPSNNTTTMNEKYFEVNKQALSHSWAASPHTEGKQRTSLKKKQFMCQKSSSTQAKERV